MVTRPECKRILRLIVKIDKKKTFFSLLPPRVVTSILSSTRYDFFLLFLRLFTSYRRHESHCRRPSPPVILLRADFDRRDDDDDVGAGGWAARRDHATTGCAFHGSDFQLVSTFRSSMSQRTPEATQSSLSFYSSSFLPRVDKRFSSPSTSYEFVLSRHMDINIHASTPHASYLYFFLEAPYRPVQSSIHLPSPYPFIHNFIYALDRLECGRWIKMCNA